MTYYFHPDAVTEIEKAFQHYTDIYPQLGKSFNREVRMAIERILETPTAWNPIKKGYRRCPLNRFPFGIIYRVNEHEKVCHIFAVMHFSRKPGYWESRKI